MTPCKSILIHYFEKNFNRVGEDKGLQGFDVKENILMVYMKNDQGLTWTVHFPLHNVMAWTFA